MKRQLSALAIVLCFAVSLLSVTALAADEGVSCDLPNCSHVAAVGTLHYDTLVDAAAAAKAGDTIYLLDDATVTAEISIRAGVTLDGQEHTITAPLPRLIQYLTTSAQQRP